MDEWRAFIRNRYTQVGAVVAVVAAALAYLY